MISFICRILKKKQNRELLDIKNRLMVSWGGGGERGGRGFGDGGVGMSKITQISRLSRLPVMENVSWKAVQMTRREKASTHLLRGTHLVYSYWGYSSLRKWPENYPSSSFTSANTSKKVGKAETHSCMAAHSLEGPRRTWPCRIWVSAWEKLFISCSRHPSL